VIGVAGAEPLDEQLGRRLQVDDQVWERHVARQQLVEPLVDEQVVVVEIQVGVDAVLLEQVVADRRLAEEVRLPQRLLLPVAVEQEEQLRLEGGARLVGVEVGQERVVRFLQDRRRIDVRGQPLGQRRLADTGGPFEGYITEIQGGGEYNGKRKMR
jgi:hypothetical protein